MNAPMRSSQLRRISVVPRAMKFFLRLLESLSKGSLILSLPDGSVRHYGGSEHGTSAALSIHDDRFAAAVLRNAEIGLAEAYRDGWCTTPDLTKLLMLAIENEAALNRIFYANPVLNIAYRAAHWLRANTRRGSRRNIAAHYDLSNDFYGQWLDPTMSYSSAMFSGDATADLKFAQEVKYQRIIDRLGISHTHHVLEIGCGWGGFAEYAARHAGAKVTGITISHAQLDYGLDRIRRAGLTDRVELKFCDYRDVTGEYDRIVSIEMFEAVGERYWADFFAVVTARLKSKGRALGADHHHCRRVVCTIPTSGRLYSALYFSRRHVAQPIALYGRSEARRACRSCAAQFRSGLRGYFAPLATPVRTKRHGTRRPGIRRGIPAVMAVLFLLLRSGFR